MATRVRLTNIKRQHREAINFQFESVKPLRHRTQRETNQAQSGFRMAFLHFLATRARLEEIKRQAHTLELHPCGHSDTQPNEKPTKHNQAPAWHSCTFWHFLATRVRLRNIKRQRREPINFQLDSLKPLRPTTQRAPNQNTIRFPHGVLALYGHPGPPKKSQASRSRGPKHSTQIP